MIEWMPIKISDLGKVVTGNTPPRKNPEYYGNHTIFIKPTDISENEKYTYKPDECYSDLGFRKYKNSLIPTGSTCVVTIGSIGKKITKAHCDCFINQAMNAVIPNENFDQEFVFYVLKYNLGQLKMLDSGTASGRENVSKSSFANIKINVPKNKDVQNRIGKTLSAYDDLIENNQKRIKLLEEIAQRTYEEWFVKFIVNGEVLPIDKATLLPVGWKKEKLKLFFDVKTGKKDANFGTKDGKYPFFTCSQEPIKSPSYSFDDAAILLAGNGEFNIKIYRGKFEAYQRTYVLIPFDQDNLTLIYRSIQKNLRFLTSGSKGAVIKYLTKDMIENFEIIYPPADILQQFNHITNPVMIQTELLIKQVQILKESRDILLPRLMSGTINVES